jgi:hypothetical protein
MVAGRDQDRAWKIAISNLDIFISISSSACVHAITIAANPSFITSLKKPFGGTKAKETVEKNVL